MRNPDAYYEGADDSELYDRDGFVSNMERFERDEQRSREQEDAFAALTEEDDELLLLLDEMDEEDEGIVSEGFEG